jgi:hypothetical protein
VAVSTTTTAPTTTIALLSSSASSAAAAVAVGGVGGGDVGACSSTALSYPSVPASAVQEVLVAQCKADPEQARAEQQCRSCFLCFCCCCVVLLLLLLLLFLLFSRFRFRRFCAPGPDFKWFFGRFRGFVLPDRCFRVA